MSGVRQDDEPRVRNGLGDRARMLRRKDAIVLAADEVARIENAVPEAAGTRYDERQMAMLDSQRSADVSSAVVARLARRPKRITSTT